MTPRDLTIESAPTLTGTSLAAAVTEASSAPNSGETTRPLLYSSITISDIDTTDGSDELAGALVRISSGFTIEASSTAGGHTATVDFLRINGNTSGTIGGSGITYNYDSATGVMTLSGPGTTAEYAAALALVTFSTSGDNVTNDGNAVTRIVSASVFDGLLYSDEIHTTVTVTGINDAPVNTVGAAMNFTEDTTRTAGNPTPPHGAGQRDHRPGHRRRRCRRDQRVVHGDAERRQRRAQHPHRCCRRADGRRRDRQRHRQPRPHRHPDPDQQHAGGGERVGAANGLVYTPNANFNGADTLTMVTNDQGNNGNDPGSTGTGTTEQDSDTKTINVADVNDAPTVTDATQAAATILEDVPFTNANAPTVADLFGLSFADAADVQVSGGNPTGSPGDTLRRHRHRHRRFDPRHRPVGILERHRLDRHRRGLAGRRPHLHRDHPDPLQPGAQL